MKKKFMLSIVSIVYLCCKSKSDIPVPITPIPVVNYNSIITNQCNFILDNQLSDGAFTMSANRGVHGYKIVPYFNNIAARALLENPTIVNIKAVKNWISWYIIHLNADGSVYDYYATHFSGSATITATYDFDSIDSYAATFLTLVRKLCEVSPVDTTWVTINYSAQLLKIGEALFSMMENDGLTIAKPTYKIKYTMDNAEVNEGIADMVWLSQKIIIGGDPMRWQTLLAKNTNGIETDLWGGSNVKYFMYKGGPVANWSVFYADATCQLYPIWCGVILANSMRAKSLWDSFNSNYPDWSTGKIYDAGGYPWTVICYVAAIMLDKTKANNYLSYVESFIDKGIQPTTNWYNLEAAFVILAAKKMR